MKNLILAAFLLLSAFSCSDKEALQAAQNSLEAAHKEIAGLQQQVDYRPGMIHNVFFWLKEDISEADEAAFLEGVKSLAAISTIKAFYIGPPAPTEDRNVIDNSYSYALLVHFDDTEGEAAYQIDPIHLKFVEDHKDKWTKVVVYDNLVKE